MIIYLEINSFSMIELTSVLKNCPFNSYERNSIPLCSPRYSYSTGIFFFFFFCIAEALSNLIVASLYYKDYKAKNIKKGENSFFPWLGYSEWLIWSNNFRWLGYSDSTGITRYFKSRLSCFKAMMCTNL